MNINGKWMSEPEVQAYVSKLQELLKKLVNTIGDLCNDVSDSPCGCDCCSYVDTINEDECCEGGSGYEYPDEWAVEAMNRVEVIIHNGCVCFGKELFEGSAYEDIQSYYPNLNEWFAECAEVIGNVHDNPELLKA